MALLYPVCLLWHNAAASYSQHSSQYLCCLIRVLCHAGPQPAACLPTDAQRLHAGNGLANHLHKCLSMYNVYTGTGKASSYSCFAECQEPWLFQLQTC